MTTSNGYKTSTRRQQSHGLRSYGSGSRRPTMRWRMDFSISKRETRNTPHANRRRSKHRANCSTNHRNHSGGEDHARTENVDQRSVMKSILKQDRSMP